MRSPVRYGRGTDDEAGGCSGGRAALAEDGGVVGDGAERALVAVAQGLAPPPHHLLQQGLRLGELACGAVGSASAACDAARIARLSRGGRHRLCWRLCGWRSDSAFQSERDVLHRMPYAGDSPYIKKHHGRDYSALLALIPRRL